MRITEIRASDFHRLCERRPGTFLDRIAAQEAFVVRAQFDPEFVRDLRDQTYRWGQNTQASWHPLLDGCPDYHRLHDNYPKAHVKQKLHAFYRHGYIAGNRQLFEAFAPVFRLKLRLSGYLAARRRRPDGLVVKVDNRPSERIVARVNVHHYPRGGGYQAMHVDPSNHYAAIQTLIAASRLGEDFHCGGVYAVPDGQEAPVHFDPLLQPGDMLVVTPGIRHGVAPIDPGEVYSPDRNDGRWIILPLFLHSDYPDAENVKPRQVS